jgi:hypothetical protein
LRRGFLSRSLSWLIRGIWFLCRVLLITWAVLAIYYSNLPLAGLRLALAMFFAALAIWLLWISRRPRAPLLFIVLFLGVVAWWISIPPSHDRPWRPEVAVMPRATIDGDRVHITGVRNFEYRGRNDFTAHYEERDLQLSHMTGLDFFVSYWSEGPVAHTFLSFIVVGDERDLVRVRTNYRNETVYLYHLNSSPDAVRRLFMIYLERINELANRPEYYHLLSNSCTINIIRYANAAGRAGRFDIRHLLNGLIDSYLYHSGRINTTLEFDELKRRSLINEAAQAADGAPDFSERIRASLPKIAR